MKYLFSLTLAAALVLSGCQQAEQNQQKEEAKEPGKLIVEQILPDGSKEKVMEVDLDNTKDASEVDVKVMKDVKGVLITDEGFLPSELTIEPGNKVIFENRGESDHWPASGIHPTHEICPGFDAGKPLKPGEIYEFVFKNEGECPMHDHLNPQLKGAITVAIPE